MRGQIFISYRRDDSPGSAGRLYDRLAARFARKQIFMDISHIACGVDFRKTVEETVGDCDVLIVVIGPQWLSSTDAQGVRRIDNPEDFVHVEIATALRRDVRVIPVLVDGALMPRSTDLPDDLKALVQRNALRVNASSCDGDCSRLISAVREGLKKRGPEFDQPFRNFLKSVADLIPKSPESGSLRMKERRLEVEQGVADNLLTLLTNGEFPKKAENLPNNTGKSEQSPVDCTVFAPDRVERKQSALLQVFLHAPDEKQQAEADAIKFDPETKERGHKSLVLDAPVGTVFAFIVEIEAFELCERTDTLLMDRSTASGDLSVRCSEGVQMGTSHRNRKDIERWDARRQNQLSD
jgi:TIR domain